MNVKNLIAALLLVFACLQTAWAQKVVLYVAGNQAYECSVSQLDSIVFVGTEPIIVGEHEWVDLGLPSRTLWATCNVGANSPEEYGYYFAWGETENDKSEKGDFTWATYKLCNGSSNSLTKYCASNSYGTVDNKLELEAEDDAATVHWGNMWQTPSLAQQDELCCECDWIWTMQSGVNGYLVKSKSNGNSIFMPAAGSLWPSSIFPVGEYGCYWSRSYRAGLFDDHALYLNFNSSSISPDYYYANGRCAGQSVRPVRKK